MCGTTVLSQVKHRVDAEARKKFSKLELCGTKIRCQILQTTTSKGAAGDRYDRI